MSANYAVERSTGLVVVVLSGILGGAKMLETARRLMSDPAYRAGSPILIDLTDLERMDANARDFLALGEMQERFIQKHGVRSRLAVLAPSDLGYGFGRMYHGFSDQEGAELISICAEASDAADWLMAPVAILEETRAAARAG